MPKTIPFDEPLSSHNIRSPIKDLRQSISASERKMLNKISSDNRLKRESSWDNQNDGRAKIPSVR